MGKFEDTSRIIANDFLQSILFIDDQAYQEEGDARNDLDPFEISKIFAKEQKICSVLNPTNEAELTNILHIAVKADVIVIDWRLDLQNDEPGDEESEDEEADVDDHRGAFTLKFIKQLFEDSMFINSGLKLIVIYTGETNLFDITDQVYEQVITVSEAVKGNFRVEGENFKILIAGKPSLATVRVREIKKQSKKYKELPSFILNEFAEMTSGLVSNVALSAISSVRKNSFKILQQYNKQMDPAFLSHRAMLPLPDDAGELLKDSIVNSFQAIIDYEKVEELCSFKHVRNWLDSHNFIEQQLKVQKKDLVLKKKDLKKWQQDGFHKTVDTIWTQQFPGIDLDQNKVQTRYRELHKNWNDYFFPEEFGGSEPNEKFSILTHHKSNFANPSYVPKLSLGAVVKGTKSNKYWLCIQQKCDSVRILDGEARRFLFLPLDEVSGNGKFNFLVEYETAYVKLQIDFSSHNLRTVKYKSNKDGMVIARRYGKSKKYFFHPIYFKSGSNRTIHQNYIWIMDLKDSHAQRAANHYASTLSRIGLDESEYLRRWAGNK